MKIFGVTCGVKNPVIVIYFEKDFYMTQTKNVLQWESIHYQYQSYNDLHLKLTSFQPFNPGIHHLSAK